jgi:hypothetical protein
VIHLGKHLPRRRRLTADARFVAASSPRGPRVVVGVPGKLTDEPSVEVQHAAAKQLCASTDDDLVLRSGLAESIAQQGRPIDYDRWPLQTTLATARRNSMLRVFWLGLGVDALTLVADLLAVAVFDAELFDAVFPQLAATNDEGQLVRVREEAGATSGVPFTEQTVERFALHEPMQPAGAALLRLAWRHREALLTR